MSDNWEPIEGETPIDPSRLKVKSVKNRGELLPLEAENIRKAIVKYLAAKPSARLAPFTYPWFLKLHEEMFCDVWEWAGQVRTISLNIGVPQGMIYQDLGVLAMDIDREQIFGDTLEQSAIIHHRAVKIHPFENGNGRWARLLGNIWLKRHGCEVVEWPEARPGEFASDVGREYLAAIKEADKGDYRALIELHRRYLPT